jgi:hypothetical protein
MGQMAKMAVHFSKVRPSAFGGTSYGSLCGRLNAASLDGMNVTGSEAEVTCKFCLKALVAARVRQALRAA